MTLSTTSSRNSYAGSGTTGPFPYSFRIFAATDLVVTRVSSSSGTETTLSYPIDYSVSGVGNKNGGSVILTAVLAVGETLVIRRVLPLKQTTDIRNQGSFNASIHEDAFDRLTMIAQQQQEQMDRVVTTTVGGAGATLPSPVSNRYLGWNASGTALENKTVDPGLTVVLPAEGRTVPNLTDYLDNNADYNPRDWDATKTIHLGTANAQPALAAANSAAAAAGRGVEVKQGSFRTNSNLTITRVTRFKNAKLKPNVGTTITINAPIEAGNEQIFDLSLGGAVIVEGRGLHKMNPLWWGVVGRADIDGVAAVDDEPAWAKMLAAIPNDAMVEIPGKLWMRVNNTVGPRSRQGIRIIGTAGTLPDGPDAAVFVWGGAADGTIAQIRSSAHCEFYSVRFYMDYLWSPGVNTFYAKRGVEIDYTGEAFGGFGPMTGTKCGLFDSQFHATKIGYISNGLYAYDYEMISIARSGADNHELHRIVNVQMYGTGSYKTTTGSIAGGSLSNFTISSADLYHVVNNPNSQYRVGTRIRYMRDTGVVEDRVINTITSTTTGTFTVAAGGASTGRRFTLGQAEGTGIKMGPNSNQHHLDFRELNFVNLRYGVHMPNGSFIMTKCNAQGCDRVIWIETSSQPVTEQFSNSEQCRQHLVIDNSGQSFTRVGCRSGNEEQMGDWIVPYGGGFTQIGCHFAAAPPRGAGTTGSRIIKPFSGQFTGIGNWYSGGMTLDDTGYNDFQFSGSTGQLTSIGERIGAAAFIVISASGDVALFAGSDSITGLVQVVNTANGGVAPNTYIALKAKSRSGPLSAGGDVLVGAQFTTDPTNIGAGTVASRTLRQLVMQQPNYAGSGHTATLFEGGRVTSPNLNGGGGGASRGNGLFVEEQQATGVADGWAFVADGSVNKSRIGGPLFQGMPASAPADADIRINEGYDYYDNATNNWLRRWRKADGTYKTSTLAGV